MTKSPIHVFAKWQVKRGCLSAVLNLLPKLVRDSTAEEGNLFYYVHQDSADADTLLLFEGYEDEAALDEHRKSEHYQEIIAGQIIPLLEGRQVILARPLAL